MRPRSLMIGLVSAAMSPLGCGAQILDNPFAEYLERGITIAPGAGNAKDTNAAIHTINPWPPYAGNTQIPGDGRRSVNSIERMYRVPNPFGPQQSGTGGLGAAPGLGTGVSGPGAGAAGLGAGTAAGIGTGTSAGAPMQPY